MNLQAMLAARAVKSDPGNRFFISAASDCALAAACSDRFRSGLSTQRLRVRTTYSRTISTCFGRFFQHHRRKSPGR